MPAHEFLHSHFLNISKMVLRVTDEGLGNATTDRISSRAPIGFGKSEAEPRGNARRTDRQVAGRHMAKAFFKGNKVLLCGNGGSASDAQHIAAEFVGRFRRERMALPSIALTANGPVMTAIRKRLRLRICV